MDRQSVAPRLGEFLNSIRELERVTSKEVDAPTSPVEQRVAQHLIAVHRRLAEDVASAHLHYRTRVRLLRLVEEANGLIALCTLLERNSIPDAFDQKRLRTEVASMCRITSLTLEPALRYYERQRQLRTEPHKAAAKASNEGDGPPESVSWRYQWEGHGDHEGRGKRRPIGWAANFPADSPSALELAEGRQGGKVGAIEVPVYFGTTRALSGNSKAEPAELFLDGRGSGSLTLGRAQVSIPPGHRIGTLEQPLAIWKIRLKPSPEKHVVLRSAVPMDEKDWVSAVRKELDMFPLRSAFVFVHGFNVSFGQAMMRAGQIARDITYAGLVTAFSWGSEGKVDGYPADEDTVQLAVPKLVEFLSSLRTKAEVTEFHIVGHSMGCRALLGALRDTSWWNTVESPVAEAVFAAPDVDATVFRETISAMKNGARRYTLYGSERDWALAVSRSIRKNHPRAGDGGARVLVVQGVETVDATAAGEHLFGLGHSYVADKRTILGDLWAVLRGHPVPRFGLEARSHMLGKYWALLP